MLDERTEQNLKAPGNQKEKDMQQLRPPGRDIHIQSWICRGRLDICDSMRGLMTYSRQRTELLFDLESRNIPSHHNVITTKWSQRSLSIDDGGIVLFIHRWARRLILLASFTYLL